MTPVELAITKFKALSKSDNLKGKKPQPILWAQDHITQPAMPQAHPFETLFVDLTMWIMGM
jgi:hypothetical protein